MCLSLSLSLAYAHGSLYILVHWTEVFFSEKICCNLACSISVSLARLLSRTCSPQLTMSKSILILTIGRCRASNCVYLSVCLCLCVSDTKKSSSSKIKIDKQKKRKRNKSKTVAVWHTKKSNTILRLYVLNMLCSRCAIYLFPFDFFPILFDFFFTLKGKRRENLGFFFCSIVTHKILTMDTLEQQREYDIDESKKCSKWKLSTKISIHTLQNVCLHMKSCNADGGD